MVSEHVKALSIKTNIVLRITKELQLYREEERMERERVQKMKNDGGDPYDIKFAENIMNESIAMVPDAEQRLKLAIKDLNTFIEENTETLYDEIAQVEMNHARQALTHAESQIRIEKCFSS